MRFYVLGIPVTVTVDDYLSFTDASNSLTSLQYGEQGKDGAMWMTILEKAAAKFYGNFEMLSGGMVGATVQMLTGGPAYYHAHKEMDADRLWNMVKEKIDNGWMVTCGSYRGPGTDQ